MWRVELEYTFFSSSSLGWSGFSVTDARHWKCEFLKSNFPTPSKVFTTPARKGQLWETILLGTTCNSEYKRKFKFLENILSHIIADTTMFNCESAWCDSYLTCYLMPLHQHQTRGRGRGMTFSCLTWGGNTAELVRRAISGFNKNWPLCYSQLNLSPSSSSCC